MYPQRILICGLPGSGKTTLAKALADKLDAAHLDGDTVREITGNKDFSEAGRNRQSRDMRRLSESFLKAGRTTVASFICPTKHARAIFDADLTIFMDTVPASPYQDTNKLFEAPDKAMVFHEWLDPKQMAELVYHAITAPKPAFDLVKPTAVMIGRFQPWHAGHRALFEKAMKEYGQVTICVRSMPQDENNPYNMLNVIEMITDDLSAEYGERVTIHQLPNVAAVVYGRDVGYEVKRYDLDPEIEAISASKIRAGEIK